MSKVLVEISARHVHVSQQTLETLFGKGYELTVKKELSQPGQYACNERVDIVGPKRTLSGVSILGPC
ncbi:MAG: propanediol utilization protein, partial [Oscillospiraceae bacterium]|nr:propanediol utilization protein [Oscillospiraceae bacterium]